MQYAILTIIAAALAYSTLAPLGQAVQGAFEQVNQNISIIQEVKK